MSVVRSLIEAWEIQTPTEQQQPPLFVQKMITEQDHLAKPFRYRIYSSLCWHTDQFEFARIGEKYGLTPEGYRIMDKPKNADGYRLKIKDRADAIAVSQSLLMELFAESLGTHCYVYSRSGPQLKVTGKIGAMQKTAFN